MMCQGSGKGIGASGVDTEAGVAEARVLSKDVVEVELGEEPDERPPIR